jgi:hypothetical protein
MARFSWNDNLFDRYIMNDQRPVQKGSRIPKGSLFFEKVVPVLLIAMGILMALLVLFAAGVLLGLVRF